jgi:predicted  nucleic acid-binding Zn-ribbon protein
MASVEFQNLLTMQDHDTVLDQLRHRRETLPERATRTDLLAQGQRIAAQRDELAKQRDVIAEREAGLEAELSSSEDRMKQLDKRLYSGEVSAARDLQAMTEEIERLKGYCSRIEDQAIEALNEREPLDAQIAEFESELRGLADQIHELERAIAAAEAEIDAEIATEQNARDALAADVPDALINRYEALRKKHGGTGAALLNGHQCGGCHLTLPATEVDRIKREPPDALILCDQCGRILVRP